MYITSRLSKLIFAIGNSLPEILMANMSDCYFVIHGLNALMLLMLLMGLVFRFL